MIGQQVIDSYIARLRAAGATGVDGYEKTLRSNSGNQSQVLNFLSEAIAALMFLKHRTCDGVSIRMSDAFAVQNGRLSIFVVLVRLVTNDRDVRDAAEQ